MEGVLGLESRYPRVHLHLNGGMATGYVGFGDKPRLMRIAERSCNSQSACIRIIMVPVVWRFGH